MQSTAYWKGKTEHIWYGFEEQVRIQLITWETCACLWAALWRSSLMHGAQKSSICVHVKQVHRLNTGCKDTHMQHSSPSLQSPSLSPAKPAQISTIPEQSNKTHYIQKKAVRGPTLFSLQWSGHNQSAYINENIKKENWDYLFVLPSKYKEIGLLREQSLLQAWEHLYKCSGSVCTPGCVPSWISSRPKNKGCLEDPSYCVWMLADALWLCQWSASYTPSASYNFVTFNTLLGTHVQAGVLWWL